MDLKALLPSPEVMHQKKRIKREGWERDGSRLKERDTVRAGCIPKDIMQPRSQRRFVWVGRNFFI